MRKLRWRLRVYWNRLFAHDGVLRDPKGLHAQPVPGIRFYYSGEPGDPDSDIPVAYERIPSGANHS